MLLLILGIALLIGAAAQAWLAERSHRETVAQVLRDYARTAAWTFDQEARSSVSSDLHMVFEPALKATTPLRPEALLLPRSDRTVCMDELLTPVRFALRMRLDSNAVPEVGGGPPPAFDGAAAAIVASEVRLHEGRTGARDRFPRSAVFPLVIGGAPHLVVYAPAEHGGDRYAYALVLDTAAARPLFQRTLASRRLLPPTLLGDLPDSDAVVLRITDSTGGVIFSTGAATSEFFATQSLDRFGGLTLSAAILPGAAERLIIGGPPASRTATLAGLLLLALGLLAVAVQQLRREQGLARLRADFVSSVSHELRTPLALQRVFLDMLTLGRADTPERRQWCIDNVDRESTRLAHLVENVLHFSRAEQGSMRVRPTLAPIAPAVAEIVDAFRPLAAPAELRLVLDLDESVEVPVDAGALRQMLMNVLENALKYGPHGQTVRVAVVLASDAAEIRVDDQGSGIPATERQAVFEPFRRGRATTDSAVAGSGIGLAVVRELARGHGGDARATEAPGGGTRISITLPHARRKPAQSARTAPALSAAGVAAS